MKRALPCCEHTFCFIHLKRNIQRKWCTVYGKITQSSTDSINALNEFISCLNKACIATTRRECEDWLERMEIVELTFRGEDDGVLPVSEYVEVVHVEVEIQSPDGENHKPH